MGIGGGICIECPLKLYIPLLRLGLPNPESDGEGYAGRESGCRKESMSEGSGAEELLALSPH